jgi:hypothetical protein
MNKVLWKEPTLTEIDIADETQLEEGPFDDAFDPIAGSLSDGGGGGGGGGDS